MTDNTIRLLEYWTLGYIIYEIITVACSKIIYFKWILYSPLRFIVYPILFPFSLSELAKYIKKD